MVSYGAQQAAVSFRKGHLGLGNLLTLALLAFTVSTSSSVTPADGEDVGDAEESSSGRVASASWSNQASGVV